MSCRANVANAPDSVVRAAQGGVASLSPQREQRGSGGALVQVCGDKQGGETPLLSPPSWQCAANVKNLPGFRAGMQTRLKILESVPKA